jgi:adenylosuccinate lyase
LRERFCSLVGLEAPHISWLTTRDRVADFGSTLAQLSATLGRIGNEIYSLARSAVGEVREPVGEAAVSSITMPHKRNPERSEHLVTLARLVPPQAHVLLDAMIGEHERDGRSWKAEWVALPEICLLVGTALEVAHDVLDGLDVDVERMAANVEAQRHALASERLLVAMTQRIGKHSAQQLLQDVFASARDGRLPLDRVVSESVELRGHLGGDEVRAAFDAAPNAGAAGDMVDAVVDGARAQRAGESDQWP